MENELIVYPAVLQILLTLILYVKNYFDNINSIKNDNVKVRHFKLYDGNIPEYVEVSRQTLKNQFELPILFYFLITIILVFDILTFTNLIFAWLFVISRYIHSFIRLTSNYIPYRARVFILGLFILICGWINVLINII